MNTAIVPADTTTPATVDTKATYTLTVCEGLTVNVTPEVGAIVRSVKSDKSGALRVSFVPASAKTGTSLKSLGYRGQGAKRILRVAKREIGSAVVGAMATAVSSGKLDWRSLTVSKTGTVGVFFNEGDVADAADLSAAEDKAAALEAKLAEVEAQLAALTAPAPALVA